MIENVRSIAMMAAETTRTDVDTQTRPPAIASLRAALPTDARVRAAQAAGDLDLERWIDGLQAATRRAGLLMSGSLLAAAHMIARLAGEPPMVDAGVGVRGLAVVGIELTRFFASDEFHRARRQVT